MAKKVNKTEEQFASVEENLSKAGLYLVNNTKKLLVIGTILIGIVLVNIVFELHNYQIKSFFPVKIYSPATINKSNADLSQAEFNFKNEKYEEALNGGTESSTIETKGFKGVISNYPYTDAANLANYYAAICQMNLSSDTSQYFEEALISLDNVSTKTKSSGTKNLVDLQVIIILIVLILYLFLYLKKKDIRRFIPYSVLLVGLLIIYGFYFHDYNKEKSTTEIIFSSEVTGLKGDAHMELGDTTKAMEFYKSAATDYVNDITTPYFMMKQAHIYKIKKDFSSALEIYNTIKSDYSESKQGINIDKHISSASNRR
jgi:tetratricopeptide (TPR) repeat protein